MNHQHSIFIRPDYRPDLRAALDATDFAKSTSSEQNCFTTFPRSYLFSGCNEKSDKADKTKEVGKDDKSNRAPVKDRASLMLAGSFDDAIQAESIYLTMFS